MAFDGITVASLTVEFDSLLTGGRIAKITQPEPDELILTIKNNSRQYRLLLSASASLPLAYITPENKPSPMHAPNFCMLLRKHLNGGKITSITQPGLERIIRIAVEHRDELGDLRERTLIIEIMGKYSNIIFTEGDTIIDAIKHISFNTSSVREVLPGRKYFIPETQNKADPLHITEEAFAEKVCGDKKPVFKALYTNLTGLSPFIAEEICSEASIDGGLSTDALDGPARTHLYHTLDRMMDHVRDRDYSPAILYDGKEPKEFSPVPVSMYSDLTVSKCDSPSAMIYRYYAEREIVTRIRQKSSDLRRVVNTALERTEKKLDLQRKQMHDTEKREKYRIYGELLNTYGYQLEPGAKELTAVNYYNGEPVTIPLDPTKSASENARKFFARYDKLKRTAEALTGQIGESEAELEQLQGISTSLDIARSEEDLVQIREELAEYGFIHRKTSPTSGKRARSAKSAPLHYRSSDGFDIFVGKNNYQNEEVSFRMASGNDWWFHAKKMPGSHVIVKTEGREVPDRTFEEAGALAAYYSKGKLAPKVEIDYTLRKNLRKPNGSRPGFVVYYTNYSLVAEPDISGIEEIND